MNQQTTGRKESESALINYCKLVGQTGLTATELGATNETQPSTVKCMQLLTTVDNNDFSTTAFPKNRRSPKGNSQSWWSNLKTGNSHILELLLSLDVGNVKRVSMGCVAVCIMHYVLIPKCLSFWIYLLILISVQTEWGRGPALSCCLLGGTHPFCFHDRLFAPKATEYSKAMIWSWDFTRDKIKNGINRSGWRCRKIASLQAALKESASEAPFVVPFSDRLL